jgi:hypothetical protein
MSQPQPSTDPFERYTHRAQTVMALAHDRARRLRRDEIDTEHLLLAITDARDSTAAMALAALSIPLDDLRSQTQTHADAGQGGPGKSIPLSAAVSAVLDRAQHEADAMGHHYVGTDHLLLALTTLTASVAAQVLAGIGVTDDRLRPEVARLLNAHTRGRRTSDEPTAEQVIGGRRFALPTALNAHNRDITEARRQKELAIDDQDFDAATAWRDEEKRLVAAKRDLADTCAAAIGTAGLVDELDRLYHQAERLRDLLHRHGIPVDRPEPDQRESAARRERRSPPTVASTTATGEHSREAAAEHRPAVVHPVPTVDATSKPVAVAPQDGVNIRGWLEGDEEHIALVRRHIEATIHEHWHNFSWTFPPRQVNGHWYAFYGAHIDTASVGWFADQLREFAAFAPDASNNQLRGVFAATGPNNATTRWLIRDRQVVTAPGDPAQEHLGT